MTRVDYRELFGGVHDARATDEFLATCRRPVFGVSAFDIVDSGKGKVSLLHEAFDAIGVPFPLRRQTIGDCVSHAWAMLVDCVAACEIARGQSEQWLSRTATEPIYSASRVEIGRGKIRGDGSVGAWAARAVKELGTVRRARYGDIDLRRYSGSKARDWGKRGTPDQLEPLMREHLIRETSLVTSFEELRDALANQYPVVICSGQGFSKRRDRDGFAKPSGSWAHAMCVIGCRDDRRPGALIVNSWGPNWISGPKGEFDIPDGAFWADADVVERHMLKTWRDSFAGSQFDGYPANPIDYGNIL